MITCYRRRHCRLFCRTRRHCTFTAPRKRLLLVGAALVIALASRGAGAEETVSGRHRAYPYIGTPAFSDSCRITTEHEDGAALAYCAEDGTTWLYDPDGQPVPNPVQPVREPGWYSLS